MPKPPLTSMSLPPPPSPTMARLKRAALVIPLLLVTLSTLLASPTAATPSTAQQRISGIEAAVPMRTHSIYAPYVDSNLQNRYWDFGGEAIVDTNRHIRLTQDRPHETGWLWTRLPVAVDNFEIVVEFNVDGTASGHHPYGDGFAIWLTEDRAKPGPVFGSRDFFNGIGIFFDTFSNSRHSYSFPRIVAMSGRGTESYNVGKDGANQELAGCSIDFRRAAVATKARITYIKDVVFELEMHYAEWDAWETCFKVDPRPTALPGPKFLGITALTGDVHDNHDIIAVTTSHLIFKERSPAEVARQRASFFAADGGASVSSGGGGKKSGGRGGLFSAIFGSKQSKSAAAAKKDHPSPSYVSYSEVGQHHASSPSSSSYQRGGGGRFLGSVFGALWTLVKFGALVGLVGSAVYAGLRYRSQQNAKRF